MVDSDQTRVSPDVSVIIPNLEGELMLAECLGSIAVAAIQITYEVIVVDNGSSDRSVEVIEKILPQAHIVCNGENRGFAEACDQGAEVARGEFLLFLNNDVVLEPACLDELASWAFRDRSAAAWQPKIVLSDGRSWDSAGSLITRTGFLLHRNGGTVDEFPFDEPRAIFSPKGACMLVRSEAFRDVGGFDKSFFCYNEETDLSWKMILRGWSIRYVPVFGALHGGGKTARRVLKPTEMNYLSFRNRLHSLLRTAEAGTLLTMIPIHLFVCMIMALAFAVRGNPACSWSIVRAMGWNVGHVRETWREREEIQKSRQVTDREMFAAVGAKLDVRQVAIQARGYLGAYSPGRR